jgi:RNA polymerase sigma-B factor
MTTFGDEEARLEQFRRYRETNDRALRNELVEEHAGLAEALARRMSHRGESHDDLRQVALVGLLKAVERFDPDHGVRFTSFATPTILGELKRHFRDRGWAVRVPRRIQELNLEVRDATATLSQELGRPPTTQEIAQRAGVDLEDVIESMEAGSLYRLASLDASVTGEDDWEPSSWLAIEDRELADTEDRLTVEELLGLLPEREQRIMYLRFFEGLTQSEIAAQVGVSQMHVSRLLARSIEALGDVARASTDPAVAARDG